jgi:hypothetical protein
MGPGCYRSIEEKRMKFTESGRRLLNGFNWDFSFSASFGAKHGGFGVKEV